MSGDSVSDLQRSDVERLLDDCIAVRDGSLMLIDERVVRRSETTKVVSMLVRWVLIAVALSLAGCGALPAAGPSANAIITDGDELGPASSFVLVDIDEKVTNVVGAYRPPSFASLARLGDGGTEIRLAVGDELAINIFEAGADGLFSSATAKSTQITVTVDETGQIFVPYVGAVRAAGRTISDLRSSIQEALEDKAIQPQVQVAVTESLANSVTLLGDVGTAGQVPVPVSGYRVLDLLAAAGLSAKTYEVRVMLRRGGQVVSADFEQLFDDPAENIAVQPGDTILVTSVPRTYTVLGAGTRQLEVTFESRSVNLAEGIARAGGLNDNLANPQGVFVFRFEPDYIAKAISERAVTAPEGTMVPVVYRINLRDPKSLFLAKLFNLRDEDILYVSNHPTAELGKFLDQIVRPLTGVTREGGSLPRLFESN